MIENKFLLDVCLMLIINVGFLLIWLMVVMLLNLLIILFRLLRVIKLLFGLVII